MVAERRPLDWALPATAPVLEALRHRGDPDADGVIARFDESLDRNAPLTAATAVQVAGDPVATDPVVNAYLAERPWPDWAEVELLARAEAFFRDHAWSLSVAFLLGSLPMSYCARDGALLLGRTGRLHDDAQRRIFETALLVMEMAEDDGLEPGGDGYLTLRRLRLLHAAVRRTVLVHEYDAEDDADGRTPWDTVAHGVPVNQLDLLGTVWAFALTSFDALEASDHDVEGAEEAWVHLWCVAGHLLGITPQPPLRPLLPMGVAEARACFGAIQERQFGPSPAGSTLAGALVEVGHDRVPRGRYDGLVEALVRDHIGDRWADALEVGAGADADDVARARWLWGLSDEAPGRSRLDRAGRWWIRRWLLVRVARRLSRRRPEHDSLRTPEAHDRLLALYLDSVGDWARRRRRVRRAVPFLR